MSSKAFKYYYDLMSQPSRALWIALRVGKTPYEDCPVAIRKGEHLTAEFRKINRFQKLPCIVDGDFHLSQSVAIARYLADKRQLCTGIYPTELQARARVDEFLEWQHLDLRLQCSLYFLRMWRDPLTGKTAPTDSEKAELLANMEKSLDALEKIWLKQTHFVSGTQLTIADLFGACEVEQTKLAKYIVEEKYPKIGDWINRVREHTNPYYDEAHKFVYKKSGIAPKN